MTESEVPLWTNFRTWCAAAIVKELRVVLDAIEARPGEREATELDGIVARASAKVDELARRREDRAAGA